MDWLIRLESELEVDLDLDLEELGENVLVGPPCECGGLDAKALIVEP